MADDLRDSPFLGVRLINFINAVLTSSSSSQAGGLTPVSAFEQKLLRNRENLKSMNAELNGELVSLLRDSKDFIPPHTSIRLLMFARNKDFFQEASDLIRFAARDETFFTDEDINMLVKEYLADTSMPINWLTAMYVNPEKSMPKPEEKETPGFKLPESFS